MSCQYYKVLVLRMVSLISVLLSLANSKYYYNKHSTYTVHVIILHTVEAATDVRKNAVRLKQKRKIKMPRIFYTSKTRN